MCCRFEILGTIILFIQALRKSSDENTKLDERSPVMTEMYVLHVSPPFIRMLDLHFPQLTNIPTSPPPS